MARVYVGTQSWGVLQDRSGNVVVDQTVTLKDANGNAVSMYASAVSSTPLSVVKTNSSGLIAAYVAPGSYTLVVSGAQFPVEAITGNVANLSNDTPQAPGDAVPGTSNEALRADVVFPDNGIHYGTGVPSNLVGGNGSSYVDEDTGRLYGPKAGGAWPGSYFSIGTRFDPSNLTGLVERWRASSIGLANDAAVASWTGENGTSLTQSTAARKPTYKVTTEDSQPAVRFDGATVNGDMLVADASLAYKHLFIVAKYTTGVVADFQGLWTGPSGIDFTLVRELATGQFDDPGTVTAYRLNGVADLPSSMDFPADEYSVIYVNNAAGWSHVPQLGQDRGDTTRCWPGDVQEIILYSDITAGQSTSVEQFLLGLYGLG